MTGCAPRMLDVDEDIYSAVYDLYQLYEFVRREQIYFFIEAFKTCEDLVYVHDCLCEFDNSLQKLRVQIEILKGRLFIPEDDASRC